MFNYLGMLALGLSLEAMITLLTPKFIPYFLFILVRLCCAVVHLVAVMTNIFVRQILYNISPVVLPNELQNPLYTYGTGFPIWYVPPSASSQGLR